MKQVIIKDGKGIAMEVAIPKMSEYEVLVKTAFSFVSIGTELSSVHNTGKPLWRRALENPSEVKKVLKTISTVGLNNTKDMVLGRPFALATIVTPLQSPPSSHGPAAGRPPGGGPGRSPTRQSEPPRSEWQPGRP